MREYQTGRSDEAARLFSKILEVEPDHADSLHLLGLVTYQSGELDAAIDLVGRAIAINAQVASYHSNMGNMLKQRGQFRDAISCYRIALDLKPDFSDARYNLGIALGEQGCLEEAVACYRSVLAFNPNVPGAHYHLGNALAQQGRPDQAMACYRSAVRIAPDFLEAGSNLGNLLREQGSLDEAIDCYHKVLAIRPDLPEVANNLGIAFADQGHLEEAVACYRSVLERKPDLAETRNNLGNALDRQGRVDEAIAFFRSALELRPDFPTAHYNLGNALMSQRRLDEAIASYRAAIALSPDYAEAYNNLGNVLREQGRLDDAVACLRRAIRIKPDFAEAHGNLAIALLARGDWTEGWEEYEWRWKAPAMINARRDFAQPRWRGEPASGRTLLVHAEQGLGDSLQFCRYAPLAAERGLRVIVEVQQPLARLLGSLPAIHGVVARGEALPDFDLHCPMLSLPLAFGTTPAAIPNASPYLHADESKIATWRTRLTALSGQRRRVGLVWAGSSKLPSDSRRSLAPEHLAPLFGEQPTPHFFSLQKDGPGAPAAFPLTDFMDEMEDFADTAALIANLDLVISVDTAVAHLAAAIGKPVWMLDRFDPDWRWLGCQRDRPWYPTLRLYRQPRPGDWESVTAAVARDLASLHQS